MQGKCANCETTQGPLVPSFWTGKKVCTEKHVGECNKRREKLDFNRYGKETNGSN